MRTHQTSRSTQLRRMLEQRLGAWVAGAVFRLAAAVLSGAVCAQPIESTRAQASTAAAPVGASAALDGASRLASGRKPVVIQHMLWDANQRPLIQQCVADFEAANPTIRVRVRQLGWDDYWTSLSTGFISGTAPDVFTNHLTKFSEFLVNGVLTDLSPFVMRDRADMAIYEPGLADLWRYQGRQYALPADWDTIALAVNLDHAQSVGLTLDELQRLAWNPRDGGTLGRTIERLTRDIHGRSPADPGFDRRRVAVWGYLNPGSGGMMGQSEWSHFAVSAGWQFQSRPWDGVLRYDDPIFIETLAWLASLPERGVSPAPGVLGRLGADAAFITGRVAMVPTGSWMVDHFQKNARFRLAWIPLPVGPKGLRSSMRNGLALSIWSGTRQPEAAWQWVRYAGSADCQRKIAQAGVVYPAVRGMAQLALAAQRSRGADPSAFVDAAKGHTFAPPMVPRAAEVNDVMVSALERVLSGRLPARQALTEAAQRVREITREP